MEGQHHHLSAEFPEFKEKIHSLKLASTHFVKLATEYEAVDKKIARSESRIELLTDVEEEMLKKERLKLKEEIYSMLKNDE